MGESGMEGGEGVGGGEGGGGEEGEEGGSEEETSLQNQRPFRPKSGLLPNKQVGEVKPHFPPWPQNSTFHTHRKRIENARLSSCRGRHNYPLPILGDNFILNYPLLI